MNIIPKMQAGSTIPLALYLPSQRGTSTLTATKKDSDGNITQKDLFGLLKEIKGLPSDTNKIVESLQELFEENSLYNNGLLNSSSLVTTYLSALLKLKIAEYNENEYKKAMDEVSKNDGLTDFAIDEHGKLFCAKANGKGYKRMSLSEYYEQAKDSDNQYVPLTNRDLLSLRAQDPNMSFDNRALDVVSNGIGEKKVTEMIHRALNKIGTSEFSKEGYTARQQDNITKGLNILADLSEELKLSAADVYGSNGLISLDGLYKTGLVTKTQQELIAAAQAYLWHAMPQNAKTWLALKSGNSDNPNKGAYDMLTHLMFASQSTTSKFSSDIQKDLDIHGNKISTKKEGGSGTKLDPVKAFVLGKGYSQPVTFNQGTSVAITVNGRYSTLVDHSGKQLGNDATLQDVTNSTFAPILDFDNATMGSQLLNKRGLDMVLLSNADIVGMDLPIDKEAATRGIIKPDFAMTKAIEEAEYIISTQGISDQNKINEIYRELGLPDKWRTNGKVWVPNEEDYVRFAAIHGIAEESAFKEDPTFDETLLEINDDNVRSGFERAMKKGDKKYSISNGFLGLGATGLYEGTIFIPVRENSVAASLGSRDYYEIPEKDATIIEAMEQESQKTSTYKKAPSLSSLM